MKESIAERVFSALRGIGLPGTEALLQVYIDDLEKKATAVQPPDREHWRYTFAGQFLAAEIAVGTGMCPNDYVQAANRAEILLTELERTN